MSSSTQIVTAEELLRMTGDQRRELVKGELRVMAPAGFEHGRIIMRLARRLAAYVEDRRLGVVLGAETGFKLARNPDTVRGADIAFVAAARIPAGAQITGFWNGAPDLAVEVVSPTDTTKEVDEKVDDYLASGARLVWVVYPKKQSIIVHIPASKPILLHSTDTLDGAEVVPGFKCPVADIFA